MIFHTKVASIILFSSFLLACNGGKNQTNIELVQNMMDQESVKAQDWDPSTEDQSAMRVPPEGTVARGKTPYKYKGEPLEAGQKLKNPLADQMSPEVLELGQTHFKIYCAVCHGDMGAGDGPVAEKMALRPPSLLSDKVRDFSDGRIFHIITDGQGVMGQYASQIQDEKSRWAIVNYVRTLQKRKSQSE